MSTLVAIATSLVQVFYFAPKSAIESETALIRQAGSPVHWSDLAHQVPPEQNAALLYQTALQTPLMKSYDDPERPEAPSLRLLNENYASRGQLMALPRERINEAMALAQRDVLPLLRQARQCSAADWGISRNDIDTGNWSATGLPLGQVLARIARTAATVSAIDGRTVAACEYSQDILAISRATMSEPIHIFYLVGLSEQDTASESVEVTAPIIELKEPDSRQAVESLEAELLDESFLNVSLVNVLNRERALSFDQTPAEVPWPFLELNQARLLQRFRIVASLMGEPTYPALQDKLPPRRKLTFRATPPGWLDIAIDPLKPAEESYAALYEGVGVRFFCIALRRMAATALAIRLYQVDHGQRPQTLKQLVPDYLPAVPRDPMAPGDQPIRYVPAAKPAMLYSLGENGVDDGGKADDRADIVFMLDERPVQTQPAER